MIFEFYEIIKGNIAIFDIDINTSKKKMVPKLLKQNQILTDSIINIDNNSQMYYYTPLNHGTEGEVLLNFNRGTGQLYGKILYLENNFNWDQIDFNKFKEEKILISDLYEQKISFNKNMTKKCGSNCFLIIRVASNSSYRSYNQSISESQHYGLFSEFNLFFRYLGKNYIDLPNDKYIFSSLLEKNKENYYKYFIYQNQKEIFIEFKSDNCILEYSFDKNKFYPYNNDFIMELKNITNITILYIKISQKRNIIINNSNMYYKLRVFKHNYLYNNIYKIETNNPLYCTLKGAEYCDYLLSLDNIYYNNTIVELAVEEILNNNKKLSIYFKILDPKDSKLELNIKKWGSIWPNKLNNTGFSHFNTVNISITDYLRDKSEKIGDLFLLFRVYKEKNSQFKLFSYIHENIDKKITINPLLNENQFLSCYNNTKIKIKIPDDDYYYVQINNINEKATVTINEVSKFVKNGLILNNIKNVTLTFEIDEIVEIDKD